MMGGVMVGGMNDGRGMVGGVMVRGMDDERGELHVWLVSFPDYFHPVRKQKKQSGNETRLWHGWITATQALSAHTHTYLYMMFPLSRAFILPHCPFSKASCKGSKGQLSPIVRVLFPCSAKFDTDCP